MYQKQDDTVIETAGGIGFFGMLTIAFIVLKLTSVIDWSWWLVLLPLWGPFAAGLLVFLFALLYVTLSGGHMKVTRTKKNHKEPTV